MSQSERVEGFETPGQFQKPNFAHVAEVILVDLCTAEDLFARVAKRYFNDHLLDRIGDISRQCVSGVIAQPTWVIQQSLATRILDDRGEVASMLERCVQRIIDAIQDEAGKNAVLIDALSAKVHPLGGGFFNFVLKQSFTVGHEQG